MGSVKHVMFADQGQLNEVYIYRQATLCSLLIRNCKQFDMSRIYLLRSKLLFY